jgi:hypothetical protein
LELWIALGILYGLQCLVWLPEGTQLFVRVLGDWWVTPGPGWRMLHPRPSAPSLLAAPLPLLEQTGRWRGRGNPTWASSRGWKGRGMPVEREDLARIEVRGVVLRLDGRALGRAIAPVGAEPLADWLRGLAEGGESDAARQIEAALAASLSLARYREAKQRLAGRTRWLRTSSDLYALGLFLGLPSAAFVWGSEPVLLRGLPALGALHLLTLFALIVSWRRLYPGRGGEVAEAAFSAAFYPPLLLRAYGELRTRELALFHPAVVAIDSLPVDQARAFLRGEILRAAATADATADASVPGIAQLERRALEALESEWWEGAASLWAEPPRHDPGARSYCPACHVEYASGSGTCNDCDLVLTPYAAA